MLAFVVIASLALGILIRKSIKLIHRLNYFTIFDGLFFGGVFFIIFPIYYSLFFGSIDIEGLDSFNASIDISLTLFSFGSILCIGVFSVVISRRRPFFSENVSSVGKRLFSLILLFYFISLFVFFLATEKFEGASHWYRGNEVAFSKGPLFVLIGQIHNVARVVLPGLCLHYQMSLLKQGKLFRTHIYLALLIPSLDLVFTGNRISILFFGISLIVPFLFYRKYKFIALLICLSIPVAVVSKSWPVVRGLLWTERITIAHLSTILSVAYKSEGDKETSSEDVILAATEASNITALKYVFDSYPSKFNFTFGETLILKSFGTMIPKSVWRNKPEPIGMIVGEKANPDISLVLNSTLLGDCWANFGYAGVLYVCVMLYLLNRVLLFNTHSFFSSAFFMVSIASWRFDFSFYFTSLFVVLLYVFLLRVKIIKIIANKVAMHLFR